jgi:hypothetical protein
MKAISVKPSQADFLLGHSISKLHHDIMYTEQAVILKTYCTEETIASALDITSHSYSKFYSLRHRQHRNLHHTGRAG